MPDQYISAVFKKSLAIWVAIKTFRGLLVKIKNLTWYKFPYTFSCTSCASFGLVLLIFLHESPLLISSAYPISPMNSKFSREQATSVSMWPRFHLQDRQHSSAAVRCSSATQQVSLDFSLRLKVAQPFFTWSGTSGQKHCSFPTWWLYTGQTEF